MKPVKPAETASIVGAPGAYLRQARENHRLSQQEVALQLRLSETVIENIDNDHYHKLPGAIFVRGYLRAYARVVGASEETVIQAFNRLEAADTPGKPLQQFPYLTKTVGADGREGYLRWTLYLAILAACGLSGWIIADSPSLKAWFLSWFAGF